MRRPSPLYGPPPPQKDLSSWSLLAANLVALILALVLDWRLADLLLVYWFQSIVIGGSYVSRILNLEKFSTKNFKINKRSVEPTPETKRQVAGFFCIHFGFFHLGYLVFIFAGANAFADAHGPVLNFGLFFGCLAFLINHSYSYFYFRDKDREGEPNIGTMMFTPYLRIIPMHLTIIFGGMLGVEGLGLIIFMALKTASDILMHWVEHKVIHRARS